MFDLSHMPELNDLWDLSEGTSKGGGPTGTDNDNDMMR